MSAKNILIRLGTHFARLIETQAVRRHFGRNRDVVRAASRRLKSNKSRLDALQDALIEGERSGPPAAFDFNAVMTRKRSAATRMTKA